MKTINIVLLFVFVSFIPISGCEKQNFDANSTISSAKSTEEVSSANSTDWGTPKIIHIPVVDDDEKNVNFAIITDTHVDAYNACCSKYRDTPRVKRNRECVKDLNLDAIYPNYKGIIHMGDMVDANNCQNLIAFRQMWENDYPGHDGGAIAGAPDDHYTAYSAGYKIKLPVFPTLGNHDSPYYDKGESNWRQVAHYIDARIPSDTPGLVSKFGKVAYAWRWGQYFFIQLGMWAGSYEHESNTEINYNKLNWLKNILEEHVGNSNLGVIIFQHYGFDSNSVKDRWWNHDMRVKELDILCRKKHSGDHGDPYNIIAIFTGHSHRDMHKTVEYGYDLNGNPITFDNYIIRSGGSLTDDQYGYALIHLTENKLWVHTKNIVHNKWTSRTKSISTGK